MKELFSAGVDVTKNAHYAVYIALILVEMRKQRHAMKS